TASVTLRLDYTMSPTMTLQVYASPFVSKGSYSNIRELASPRAANYDARFRFPTVSTADQDPGFNFKQFRSNVVFRWEYRPGSTLFLVWQQGREDSQSLEGNRSAGENLRDLFHL